MKLEEKILEKLSPIEKFAIKAKMHLEWEEAATPEGAPIPNTFMDQDHIEALTMKPFVAYLFATTVDLKRLRAALLAFQRNGAKKITIFVNEKGPLALQMAGKDITYSIAPWNEDDE